MEKQEIIKKITNFGFKIIVLVLLGLSIHFTKNSTKNDTKTPEICETWFRATENCMMRICYDPLGRCDRLDIAFDRTGFFISIPYTVLRKTKSSLPKGEVEIEFELKANYYNKTIRTQTRKIAKKVLFEDTLANCPEFERLDLIEFITNNNFD